MRHIHADVCCRLSVAHVEAIHLQILEAVHLILLGEALLLQLVRLEQRAQAVLAHSLGLLVHELGQEGLRATILRVRVADLLLGNLLALLLDSQLLEELLFRWD